MNPSLPDDAWLRAQAGDGAFARGRVYCRDGRIELFQVSDNTVTGQAFGTDTYRVRLTRAGQDWRGHCDCPAADGGMFCKHLVAAVLTARDRDGDADGDADGEADTRQATGARRAAREPGELHAFLCAQPAERLAGWLMALAKEDRHVERQLLLHRAASQPGALKEALAKVLATGGFLDYRRTLDYAARLAPAIAQLHGMLQRDPQECRALCEYTLKRLFRIIERCDDSAGSLGDRLSEVAELHARACAASPPGKSLAKILYTLQAHDDWNLLPLPAYWDLLERAGQAAYAKLVLKEFDGLPPPRQGAFDMEGFGACRRAEALARCSGDFELLQRVLRRDLSSPYQHLRVLESLHESGHARDALAWAENAVKRFPDDGELRAALADCLADAGLEDEAMEQDWQRFQQHPSNVAWTGLKRRAGSDWAGWRERALAHAQSREDGHATLRIDLLMHDGDIDAAVELARDQPVSPGTLQTLAERTRKRDPDSASAFYLRVARQRGEMLRGLADYQKLTALLAHAAGCGPSAELQAFVADVRVKHGRKPRLMAMLAEAGL